MIREAIAHYPPALRTALQVCRSRGDPGKRTTEDSLFWNFSRASWLCSALPFALPPIGLLPTGLEPVPVNTPRVAVLWLLPSFLQVDEGVIHPRDLAQASKGPAGYSGRQGGALELSLRCPVPKSPFFSSHFWDQQALPPQIALHGLGWCDDGEHCPHSFHNWLLLALWCNFGVWKRPFLMWDPLLNLFHPLF